MSTKRVDLDVLEMKEFKAAAKMSGDEYVKEFAGKTDEELKKYISYALLLKNEKTQARDANANYQKACEDKKLFDKALAESIAPEMKLTSLAIKILALRKEEYSEL